MVASPSLPPPPSFLPHRSMTTGGRQCPTRRCVWRRVSHAALCLAAGVPRGVVCVLAPGQGATGRARRGRGMLPRLARARRGGWWWVVMPRHATACHTAWQCRAAEDGSRWIDLVSSSSSSPHAEDNTSRRLLLPCCSTRATPTPRSASRPSPAAAGSSTKPRRCSAPRARSRRTTRRCHVMACRVMSCHVVSCRVMLSPDGAEVSSYHTTPRRRHPVSASEWL